MFYTVSIIGNMFVFRICIDFSENLIDFFKMWTIFWKFARQHPSREPSSGHACHGIHRRLRHAPSMFQWPTQRRARCFIGINVHLMLPVYQSWLANTYTNYNMTGLACLCVACFLVFPIEHSSSYAWTMERPLNFYVNIVYVGPS